HLRHCFANAKGPIQKRRFAEFLQLVLHAKVRKSLLEHGAGGGTEERFRRVVCEEAQPPGVWVQNFFLGDYRLAWDDAPAFAKGRWHGRDGKAFAALAPKPTLAPGP